MTQAQSVFPFLTQQITNEPINLPDFRQIALHNCIERQISKLWLYVTEETDDFESDVTFTTQDFRQREAFRVGDKGSGAE